MNDRDHLHSSFLIKLLIDSCQNSKNRKNVGTYLENIYDAFKEEEITNKENVYYLLYKIVEFNIEDQAYNTIIAKHGIRPIAADSKKEKLLVEIITYFGDRNLFINCDYEKSKKWYKLLNTKMFDRENIRDIKQFVESIDNYCKNGFFLYTHEKYNDIKLLLELVSLERITNYLDISTYVRYTDEVFELYYSIKNEIKEIFEARKVFCEILYRINQVLIQNIYSIHNSNNGISNEMKKNINFLSSIVYENELLPYKDYIVSNINTENITRTIFNIVDSIVNIEKIKSNLLVSEKEKPNLAYYTRIDSFSYMLPYKIYIKNQDIYL